MAVRVQIAGVSSVEEALEIERAGGDALGFTVRLPHGIHDGLTDAKARSIIAVLPPFITSVAITYASNAREAMDIARYLGVGAIQLHGDFPVAELTMLRAGMSHLKIIKAVHITGRDAIEQARPYERRVDAIILDTYDPQTGRHGATGKTHDWSISREIVDKVRTPIILAGGLTPDTVVGAIETVRPWAVDVHTGIEDADGSRNFAKIRTFIERVRSIA